MTDAKLRAAERKRKAYAEVLHPKRYSVGEWFGTSHVMFKCGKHPRGAVAGVQLNIDVMDKALAASSVRVEGVGGDVVSSLSVPCKRFVPKRGRAVCLDKHYADLLGDIKQLTTNRDRTSVVGWVNGEPRIIIMAVPF